jgi:hypothetical protein
LCRVITGLTAFSLLYAVVLYILAQTEQRSETVVGRMEGGFGTLLILVAIRLSWDWYWQAPADANRRVALAGLLVLDLFSVTMMLAQNYQAIPVRERLIVPAAVAEFRGALDVGGRIESNGGLEGGYGTLYHLPDVYGSDPLQLESTRFYLEDLSPERRRELLGVRAYYSDAGLQRVENPRGFGHLVYAAAQVQTVDEARGLVQEPALDLRRIAVIEEDPGILLDSPEETGGNVVLEKLAPERIELRVENERPALLTLSLPYFPGWKAKVDGEEVDLLRTYAGLSGVALTAGQHDVILMYESRWLALAAVLSLVAMLGILGGLVFFR